MYLAVIEANLYSNNWRQNILKRQKSKLCEKKIKKHYFYKKLRWFMTKLEHKKQEENK